MSFIFSGAGGLGSVVLPNPEVLKASRGETIKEEDKAPPEHRTSGSRLDITTPSGAAGGEVIQLIGL
ncbi:hypothetical protein EYF80_031036 [Liparis tanakae]|uniref:Uncharacterized protein n=1 Tax=Liparis tanakae TaxID=230148 RepID=A0A4Z2GZH0_9TELE|nr:hypothetical protein EYF80_031036 [Liparis tanakae]